MGLLKLFILSIMPLHCSVFQTEQSMSIVQAVLKKYSLTYQWYLDGFIHFTHSRQSQLLSCSETKGKAQRTFCNAAGDIRKSHQAYKPEDDSL